MDLLDRARAQGNPLIDGARVTFVWQGRTAPHLIDDLHLWEEDPQSLTRRASDLWSLSFEIPQNAYLEYAFLHPKTRQRVPDPFNRRSVYNGLGGHNHYFYMPMAEGPTPLARQPKGGLRGRITRHMVPAETFTASRERHVYLYQPPVTDAVPLLVVFDGTDYLRRGRLAQIVDNLIAQNRIRPLAVAFVQNGGRARAAEYGCSESTLIFVETQLLPSLMTFANISDHRRQPGVHGILGASMGGLMALFTGLRQPHIFGRALAQSGAFQLWDHETNIFAQVRHQPRADVRIYMAAGALEQPWALEGNRRMHTLLEQRGYEVSYEEFAAGHCYTAWRDTISHGLEALFAP